MARRLDDDDGFTLTELLVVIIVLGVLAAVVIFAVSGLADKGRSNAVDADRATLERAEEAFLAKRIDDARRYATEDELLADGMLHTASTLHDVCLSTNKKQYRVVPQGTNCATVTF